MSFFSKPLDSLEESDLQILLDNEVSEGKTIDYKEALHGNSDSDKKEFLYDISSLEQQSPPLLSETGRSYRYNFDGFLSFSDTHYSYTQTFRNGIIEAVDACMVIPISDSRNIQREYEKKIIQGVTKYTSIQKKLGAEPPFFIMLSLLDVKGYSMSINSPLNFGSLRLNHQIDRSNLLVPEVLIENFDFESSKVMKPIFDAVWNACGYSGSQNYDDSGNWRG